jgi:hypothetical protein
MRGERRVPDTKGLLVPQEPFSLERPYPDRQQIVVVPDELVDAERRARTAVEAKDGLDADKITELVLNVLKSASAPGMFLPAFAAELVIRGVARLREKGVDVLMVGRAEAEAQGVQFAPGHPFEQVVYVGHPAIHRIYYPAAEFHRRVFEHKFCEAVDLLMNLGASKLTVEHQSGFGREHAAELDVPLTPKERLGGKVSRTLSRQSHVLFDATFPGSVTPALPEHMVWFDTERTWQTLARARLVHGTASFALTVRYENDYGVTRDLKASIEGVKLQVGGKFHEQQDTVWRISAEFPPISRSEQRTAPARLAEVSNGSP